MPLLRSILSAINAPATERPPVSTCKTLADKDALANWIVSNYLKNGSATLESVIERQADLRFCSLLCLHLAMAIFGSSGADMIDSFRNAAAVMGFRLVKQSSGRLADTRTQAIMATPAKYRGFGATLNNPEARGHLFQINMLSFVEPKTIIGILEAPERDTSYPIKGLRPVGNRGPWRLFELDPSLSDDCTALIVKPDKGDVRVEFAQFDSVDDLDYKMFYRINTAR